MTELVKYDAACRALSEARSTDEVRNILNTAEAMRAYARQAKNRLMETDAAEIRIRSERRLGELIKAQKETVGLNQGAKGSVVTGAGREPVKDERPTLAEASIDKKLSSRAQQLAELSPEGFERRVADWRGGIEAGVDHVTVSFINGKNVAQKFSGDWEYYTPAEYIEAARQVMGDIDLDPASNEVAQQTVKAERWYDQYSDGLAQHWAGRVFLNPPYSYPLIGKFIDKLIDGADVTQAILLTNNSTDTRWWHKSADESKAICFTRGRINFYKANGNNGTSQSGQTFFYFGANVENFRQVFRQYGLIR